MEHPLEAKTAGKRSYILAGKKLIRLLPCKACGSAENPRIGGDRDGFWIYCSSCQAKGASSKDPMQAVADWNGGRDGD